MTPDFQREEALFSAASELESASARAAYLARECAGDDLNIKMPITTFPRLVKLKPGETVVFSWIVFKNRAHRDRVNDKVMNDPRLAKMMATKDMPFDVKRMSVGGFKTIVYA